MCRPQMVPQQVVPLIPPVLGHYHNAPPIARIVMVQPMYLHGERMIRCRMTATMTVPTDTGNAPHGRLRARLGGSANSLPGKQEAPVPNAVVHTDLLQDKRKALVQFVGLPISPNPNALKAVRWLGS
jgi:hypothetical protein